jgi:lipopolysaccharide export system protein LptA
MMRLPSLVGLIGLIVLPALADTGVTFAGLKTDPKAPVQVQADSLQVNQSDGTAVFSGNVVVTQSTLEMKAATVTVIYDKDKKGITSLHAAGGVTVKAGENAASADDAVYTVATSNLVMTGKVILTEAQATLAGESLTIDLKTGLGTMSGRVTSTFTPATSGK